MKKHWLVNPLNIFLIAGITLIFTQNWIPVLFISVMYFSTRNYQIASPDFGIIYLFGRAIKRVGPGFGLRLPGVYVETRKGAQFSVEFGDENVLTGENNIGVGITGTIYLLANPKFESLDKLLEITEELAITKSQGAANTTLEKETAKRDTVIELLKDKDEIRKAIKENVIEALGGETIDDEQEGGAYIVNRIQIADTDAKTLTSAAYIREQGTASAEAAKKLKDAIGEKAYIPQTAAEIGRAFTTSVEKITEVIANHKENSNDVIGELNSTMKNVVEKMEKLGGNHD